MGAFVGPPDVPCDGEVGTACSLGPPCRCPRPTESSSLTVLHPLPGLGRGGLCLTQISGILRVFQMEVAALLAEPGSF